MATITWRRGDSAVLNFAPEDGSGEPVDLAGASAQIEISTATTCITLPLDPVASGFEWRANDDTMPDLPARVYRASFVLTWPDGIEDRDDFQLLIEGGC